MDNEDSRHSNKSRFQEATARSPFKCEDCKQGIDAGQTFFWDSERKAGPRQYSWRICTGCKGEAEGETRPAAPKSVFSSVAGTDTIQIKSTDLEGLLNALRNIQRSQEHMQTQLNEMEERQKNIGICVMSLSRTSRGESLASLFEDGADQ